MRTSFPQAAATGLAPWTGDLAWRHQRRFDRAAAVRCCRLMARRRDPVALFGLQRLERQRAEAFYAVEAATGIIFDLFEMEGSGDRRRRALEHWAGLLRSENPINLHPVRLVLGELDLGNRLFGLLGDMAEVAGSLCQGADPPTWESLLERSRRLVTPCAEALLVAGGQPREGSTDWLVDLLSCRFLCDRWYRLSREFVEGRLWLPLSWCGWVGIEAAAGGRLDVPSGGMLVRLAAECTRELFRKSLGALLEISGPLRQNLLARWFAGRARLHLVDELGADVLRRPPPEGMIWLGRSAVGAGLSRLGGWLRWN